MANSLMGMMGGAQGTGMNMGALQQMQSMMSAFRAMANPQQAITQAMQNNPNNSAAMRAMNGENPVEIFKEECRAHGKDPEQMMKALGLTPPKGC